MWNSYEFLLTPNRSNGKLCLQQTTRLVLGTELSTPHPHWKCIVRRSTVSTGALMLSAQYIDRPPGIQLSKNFACMYSLNQVFSLFSRPFLPFFMFFKDVSFCFILKELPCASLSWVEKGDAQKMDCLGRPRRPDFSAHDGGLRCLD